jgi:hypothetical protein
MHDSITSLLLNIFNTESLLNELEQQAVELLLRTVLLVRELWIFTTAVYFLFMLANDHSYR